MWHGAENAVVVTKVCVVTERNAPQAVVFVWYFREQRDCGAWEIDMLGGSD